MMAEKLAVEKATKVCPKCGSCVLSFGPRGYFCQRCSTEFRRDLGTYQEPKTVGGN